jgi:UDP-2,4-diacetamido-2,4,6-trideoxy-beta-L-altropyranose hydrolase
MKVAFRTDASISIGTVHFMRCLTLAVELKQKDFEVIFISYNLPAYLCDMLKKNGFAYVLLGVIGTREPTDELLHSSWLGTSQHQDAKATVQALSDNFCDWLIVDHYALDERWEKTVRVCCKKLMVIDDLADRSHQCDLLLDQNLGRQLNDYVNLVPKHCKVLAGSQYALLRPEFAALRSYSLQRRKQPVLKQMLITMGGIDQPNATGQVMQLLKSCILPQDCRISVVMGAEAPWLQQVRAQAQDMPWPTEVLVNVSNMAQRMADSDLAIGAAGSTSWERCCLGLPTLMVVLADNQRAIAEVLQAAGAAKILDNAFAVPTRSEVLSSFVTNTKALYEMSIKAARIVDGLGAASVVSTFLTLENL